MAIEAGDIRFAAGAGRRSCGFAIGYAEAGYGAGHRVGLLLENRPAFFLHWFALNALGCSIVPLNPDLRIIELSYVISHSELVAIVAIPVAPCRVAGSRRGAPGADRRPGRSPPPVTAGGSAVDEAALLYTSGTTGRPKGCVLPNEYFLAAGALVRRPERPGHNATGDGAHADAAAVVSHERTGLLGDGDADDRRLPDPAGPLPSAVLVANGAGVAGNHRSLSRRHAGDPDGRSA